MIGYLIPAGLVIFWSGFALGRVGAAPRGRRAVPRHALQDGPPGQPDTPQPPAAATEPHRAAEPATVVSSATLDDWAARFSAAPVVEDQAAALDPLPRPDLDRAAAPPGPAPRNVIWQPTAAAAAATALPTYATGAAAAVAGWYWHEYLRTEQEMWGPGGIDGPWSADSIAGQLAAAA